MAATAYEALNSVIHTVRRVDTSGDSQLIQVGKLDIMRRCDLPARDLILLDSPDVYPYAILARAKAIAVNLDYIRCIIAADEVLLLEPNSTYVIEYAEELQRRLRGEPESNQRRGVRRSDSMFGNMSPDYLPFEFRALELALEFVHNHLGTESTELEIMAYPLLDHLTSNVSTLNLERVRQSKSRLFQLTRRVEKVRDEIKQLMDDDKAMAEMYLTEKKRRHLESSISVSSSTPDSTRLDRSPSKEMSRHESMRGYDSATDGIEELALLLGAYLVVIDRTLKKLTTLREYIDDTEAYINIHLDTVRNELIKFDLLMTTATFVLAIFGVVFGIFGTNLKISLYDSHGAFKWVLIITGVCGAVVFCSFVCYFKYKRLMPQ